MIFARKIYFCPNLGGGASATLPPSPTPMPNPIPNLYRTICTRHMRQVCLCLSMSNGLNMCWNDFGFHRWELIKYVQLYCERLDLVRIGQFHGLKF